MQKQFAEEIEAAITKPITRASDSEIHGEEVQIVIVTGGDNPVCAIL